MAATSVAKVQPDTAGLIVADTITVSFSSGCSSGENVDIASSIMPAASGYQLNLRILRPKSCVRGSCPGHNLPVEYNPDCCHQNRRFRPAGSQSGHRTDESSADNHQR